MKQAILRLSIKPKKILVDGTHVPNIPHYTLIPCIKGDQRYPVISAASIVAKGIRDRIMHACDRKFPGYLFSKHKGYPTQQHRNLLAQKKCSPIHRKSYKPCQNA